MDHLRRQRRGAATGDPELRAAPAEPDYATALGQEGTIPAGELRYGEASPSTLEQGGAVTTEPVGAAEMTVPVASPFHSERVKEEVALARSRPRTLDEDARKMGEVSDAGLGDANLSGRNDEPAYFEEGSIQSSQPRVARIERTVEAKAGELSPELVAAARVVRIWDLHSLLGRLRTRVCLGRSLYLTRLGMIVRVPLRTDCLAGLALSNLRTNLCLMTRVSWCRQLRVRVLEAMLLQVIEKNRLLRGRLDQVERSSWHSGGTRNTGELPVGSPVSFAPPSDFPVGAGHSQPVPTALERFVREGDLRAQMSYGVARFSGYSPQLDSGSGSQPVGLPSQGDCLRGRRA